MYSPPPLLAQPTSLLYSTTVKPSVAEMALSQVLTQPRVRLTSRSSSRRTTERCVIMFDFIRFAFLLNDVLQNIYLTGSIDALGDWDTSRAVSLISISVSR